MNYLSLFSGIGGLDLGLDRAGMTCVGQVERDPFCQRVLAKHWPEVPRHDDVRTAPDWWLGTTRPRVDLVVGGFPCQPFSIAGRRQGVADERWGWPWFADVVRVARPRYVLVENVSALLRDADAFGWILADLAALGFDTEWDCVPAAAVGAPHRRDRLFLVAYACGIGRREERQGQHGRVGASRRCADLADPESDRRRSRGQGRPAGDGAERTGFTPPELADTDRQPPLWAPVARSERDPRGVESRLRGVVDGLPEGLDRAGVWAAEWPDTPRVAQGVPARVDRLRGLGNAVVPQVAEHVGRLILDHAGAVAA